MDIVLVGLNHETASVPVREKLSFPENLVQGALKNLIENSNNEIIEAVILSTCNRVEIYAVAQNAGRGITAIQDFMSRSHQVPLSEFSSCLVTLTNLEAIQHLFSVASSIKSMVLGENQIQGQIKNAFEIAQNSGTACCILSVLFQNALTVGKRVRNETRINEHSLSISHAAVTMLKSKYANLTDKRLLVVGNGKMGVLAIRALQKIGVNNITLINRTREKGEELARQLGLNALGLDRLPESLVETDVVISSTGAPHAIITKGMVEAAVAQRKGSQLLLIDIAVPRDVEEGVADVEGAELCNIDQLQGTIDSNRGKRACELEKVEAIVSEEVDKFLGWLHTLDVKPVIKGLRSRAEHIREQELQRALRRLEGELSESDARIVSELTTRIINKMLHVPIAKLREEAACGNGKNYTNAVKHLFALDEQEAANGV